MEGGKSILTTADDEKRSVKKHVQGQEKALK